MPEPDQPTGPPESETTLSPFAAQVGSALDAAGIAWQLDDDGDLRVLVTPHEGRPLHVYFRTIEPDGERVLLVCIFNVLPDLNTPALLPLSRTTVCEVLNWMHQHKLGVTFYITLHNFVACTCAFPVYGRPRREQVKTVFNLVLGAVNQVQAALRAALQGASVEQALRLVAESKGPGSRPDGETEAEGH